MPWSAVAALLVVSALAILAIGAVLVDAVSGTRRQLAWLAVSVTTLAAAMVAWNVWPPDQPSLLDWMLEWCVGAAIAMAGLVGVWIRGDVRSSPARAGRHHSARHRTGKVARVPAQEADALSGLSAGGDLGGGRGSELRVTGSDRFELVEPPRATR